MIKKILLTLIWAITLNSYASYTTDSQGHTIAELPYQTSFDNTYNEYDGKSFLPIGWVCSGDNPFYTANTRDIEAADGAFYAISVNNSATLRNDRLYTPHFAMEAGKTYTMDFKLWMPGLTSDFMASDGFGDTEFRAPKFTAYVGEEQDFDFQATQLFALNTPTKGWQSMHLEYTPAESGAYCFCLAFDADVTYTGDVAIDDIMVSFNGAILRPTAQFSFNGKFSLMDGSLVTTEGSTTRFTYTGIHATDFEWTVVNEEGKRVAHSTEQNPNIAFSDNGMHTVTLRAYNSKFEATSTQSFLVSHIPAHEEAYIPLQTYSDLTTEYIKADETPCLLPDVYDFVTGPNHYYHRFAERVELPQNVTLSLQTLNYWLCSCTLASVTTGEVEGKKPFTFAIYGEKDGRPDMANLIYSRTMPLNQAFTTNTSGMGGAAPMSQSFPTEICGTFYFAFEFPDNVTLDTKGGNRTSVEMMANRHRDGISTLYYYSDTYKTWQPIDAINPSLAGLGLQLIFWGNLKVGDAAGIHTPQMDEAHNQGRSYDINGRALQQPAFSGLYIQNGHKYLAR